MGEGVRLREAAFPASNPLHETQLWKQKELEAKPLITTRKNCEKIAANVKRAKTATHTLVVGELRPLGHARYIKILITWLRGFRDKLLELVVSFLGFVESRDKRSFPLLRQICNFVLKSSEAG